MKKMKNVCALLLCSAMAVSVFGCSKTADKKDSDKDVQKEENEGSANDEVADAEEDTASAEKIVIDKEPDTVIEYGTEGKYSYTMTIYGCDGAVTKYEGKTDLKEWKDLWNEMVEADIFSYEVVPIMDESGQLTTGSHCPVTINGQNAGAGYYACYLNGAYNDDFGSTTNIIGIGANDLVIKYTENNWLPSEDIYMPDPSVVFRVLVCSKDENWSITHAATDVKNAKAEYDYNFRHELNSDRSKTEGTFTDAYWNELIGIIEDLPDLEIVGKTSQAAEREGKILIYYNLNVCVMTSDPDGKLVSFLNGYETNPEITLK